VTLSTTAGEQIVSAQSGSLPAESIRVRKVALYDIKDLKDADLGRLAQLTHLRSLVISGCPMLTDACTEHIARIESLGQLVLNKLDLSAAAVRPLSRLPHLKLLGFCAVPVAEDWLPLVAELPALEHLTLQGIELRGAWCTPLRKAPLLKGLSIDMPQIGDDSWQDLLAFGRWEQLAFRVTADVPPARLEQLGRLPQLRKLSFWDHFLNRSGLPTVEQFEAVAELKQVKIFHLGSVGLTNEHLTALAPLELEELAFGSSPLKGVDLDYLKRRQNLKVLRLTDTGLTAEAVAELRQAMPECTIHFRDSPEAPEPGSASPGPQTSEPADN
jgi:hypothetical protein